MSFWGWGYADRFPDLAERRGLAALVGGITGGRTLVPRDPPVLEQIALPRPRLAVPERFAAMASAAPGARASHTYGKSFCDLVRGFAGDFASAPDMVVSPTTEDEVVEVLEWCARNRVACIPFGGGTSVVGGVEGIVPESFAGVVSLDMRSMNRLLEVDPVSRAARIQAGATGPVLEAALAEHGLTLRHFPQSFEFSTLGGWLATRAGGHFATLYTHIDDLVESIRMLTPQGPWESRRLPGSGAGPSPDRLVLGSEGTLGVITESWLRVSPRPRWRSSASVRFGDFARAVHATREIAQAGLYPANCRLLDAGEAMIHRVSGDGRSVLLLGFESADHPVSWPMHRALEIARAHGGESSGARHSDTAAADGDGARAGDAASWRAAFFAAPYRQSALVSIGAVVDTFETACTWDRFDALDRGIRDDVGRALREVCGGGLVSARFTHVYPDGPAPYYTFIAPGREGGQLEQWAAIKAAAAEAILRAGGTITHHHAVGRMHQPWYQRQRPPLFGSALRAVKYALDPAGVLNPGVLV